MSVAPEAEEAIPSVKDLASSEPSKRRNALNTIIKHLSSRSSSSPPTQTQCLQLWRGFSVALYMHDSKSAISVQNLIKTLAGTFRMFFEKDLERMNSGRNHAKGSKGQVTESDKDRWVWFSTYHSAFWELLSKEWSGIDFHRMNKYLSLVRFVVRELFAIFLSYSPSSAATAIASATATSAQNGKSSSRKRKADASSAHDAEESPATTTISSATTESNPLLDAQIIIFQKWPFSSHERKVPDGLRLHVLDVWSDELNTALESASATDQETTDSQADEESSNKEQVDSLTRTKDTTNEDESSSGTPAKKKRKRDSKSDNGNVSSSSPQTTTTTTTSTSTSNGTTNTDTDPAAQPRPTEQEIETIKTQLTLLIQSLAKEALNKAVRMRAKETLESMADGASKTDEDEVEVEEADAEEDWEGLT